MSGDISDKIKRLIGAGSSPLIKIRVDGATVEEQAENFFKKVYGQTELKNVLYRTVTAADQINMLLVGPPATAKSLLVDCIKENCNDVIYFDGANLTGAGLIETLDVKRKARILIIDEVDKLRKNDLSAILGLLNTGEINKDLKDKSYHFKMNVKVFATSNGGRRLTKPIKSRFVEWHLDEYGDEEFIKIVQFCLVYRFTEETAAIIAKTLIANNKKDTRIAVSVSRWIKDGESLETIVNLIEDSITHMSSESVDYN